MLQLNEGSSLIPYQEEIDVIAADLGRVLLSKVNMKPMLDREDCKDSRRTA